MSWPIEVTSNTPYIRPSPYLWDAGVFAADGRVLYAAQAEQARYVERFLEKAVDVDGDEGRVGPLCGQEGADGADEVLWTITRDHRHRKLHSFAVGKRVGYDVQGGRICTWGRRW